MIKHLVAYLLIASASTAAAEDKPAITVSNVKFSPRKAEDPKRKPFLIDITATVKLDRKVDDATLAYLGIFANCHVGTAASGDYANAEAQTPLTEMKLGKTQDIKFVAFTAFGFEQVPDKCSITIHQGADKAPRGKDVAKFCWTKAKNTVKSCK